MRFGLFLELQSRPGVDATVEQVFQRELELASLADRLGFDYVWMCEHHSLPERAYCSAPEVFLSALSQRTNEIRLGFAVVELVPQINHIVRVAERIASLDIISGGRVDVAVGDIKTRQDLEAFSVNNDEVSAMVDEGVKLLPRLWTENFVNHSGNYYQFKDIMAVPKPLQCPHPPLWQASSSRGHKVVGERGIGLLTSTNSSGYLKIPEYRTAIKHAKPVGGVINEQVGLLINAFCHDDDGKAIEIGKQAELWWWAMLQRLHGAGHLPHTFGERLKKGHFMMGDPGRCVEIVSMYEELGVDMILTWFRYGPTSEEAVIQSVKTYAEKVMSKFK